ncbi:MAG: hypothetical protein GC168_10285 [Candidatus Hydrogenedens sp.]|nr:hypothetical protein [Candidatus Hydrogenedens sp.]
MRHTLAWALAAGALFAGASHAEEPVEAETVETAPAEPLLVLDLELAQRRALAQHPTLAAVAEVVAQAQAKARQARSLYLPQISAQYTWSQTDLSDDQKDKLDEAVDTIGDQLGRARIQLREAPTPQNQSQSLELRQGLRHLDRYISDQRDELDGGIERSQLGITAGWLVFDGFARKHRNAMARYGVQESQAAEQEARRLMADAVARAYYGLLLSRENIAVSEANEEFNQRLLKDAEARYDVGKGSYSDVLNFRVAVRGAQTMRLKAEADTRAAEVALATLMAEPDAKLRPDMTVPPLAAETADDLVPPDTESLIAYALDHRPDLLQGERRADRAEAARKASAASYSPEVAVFGQVQSRGINNNGIDPDRFSPTVGVNVNYDLYTGGRRRAEVAEARHAEREAELKQEALELTVVSDVRRAALEVIAAQEQLTLQRLSLGDVQENRDLLTKAYDAGKAPLALLNQAQRDFAAAQAQAALALASLRLALEELDTATGASLANLSAEAAEPEAE